MCLAVPFEIKEICDNEAVVERDGISRKIRIDFLKEPHIGDFVLVHAGFAIEKVSRRQAEADIEAARELQKEINDLVQSGKFLFDPPDRESGA